MRELPRCSFLSLFFSGDLDGGGVSMNDASVGEVDCRGGGVEKSDVRCATCMRCARAIRGDVSCRYGPFPVRATGNQIIENKSV